MGLSPIWAVKAKKPPPHPRCPSVASAPVHPSSNCLPGSSLLPAGSGLPALYSKTQPQRFFPLLLLAFLFFCIHHLVVGAGWGEVAGWRAGWLHRPGMFLGPGLRSACSAFWMAAAGGVSLLVHPLFPSSSAPSSHPLHWDQENISSSRWQSQLSHRPAVWAVSHPEFAANGKPSQEETPRTQAGGERDKPIRKHPCISLVFRWTEFSLCLLIPFTLKIGQSW